MIDRATNYYSHVYVDVCVYVRREINFFHENNFFVPIKVTVFNFKCYRPITGQ